MSRKKLYRWNTLHDFENALNEADAYELRGRWAEAWFGNDKPIVLELACGKGDYALGLGAMHPEINIIGIDVKGDRLWMAAKRALDNGFGRRVSFLRARIDFLEKCFAPNEISDIWITFPDPQARKSTIRKRLTAPGFLARYRNVQRQGSLIHLKTDTELLYQYTHDVLAETPSTVLETSRNIYDEGLHKRIPELEIKTAYEHKHLAAGRLIKYIRFRIEGEVNPDAGCRDDA
jgi:tRNA (guanine-N7-)-methyltransferase